MENLLASVKARYPKADIKEGYLFRCGGTNCSPANSAGVGVDKDKDGVYDVYITLEKSTLREFELTQCLAIDRPSPLAGYTFSKKQPAWIEFLAWCGCTFGGTLSF